MKSQITPSAKNNKEFHPVKSAERALDLLEMIGANSGGVSFVQIGKKLGIPKSSLFALVETLLARGYIALNSDTRKYNLGLRTWEIGQAFQRNNIHLENAKILLESIVQEVNETAQLARLVGDECVYLAKKDSSHPLRLQSDIGVRLKAHATGVGKAILAKLDDEKLASMYEDIDLPAYTTNTLNSLPNLLEELRLTRSRGFAVDNEEYTPGVFCIAVPIIGMAGEVNMSISVSLPKIRSTTEGLTKILAKISKGSCDFSSQIGSPRIDPLLLELSNIDAATRSINELVASKRYNLHFT